MYGPKTNAENRSDYLNNQCWMNAISIDDHPGARCSIRNEESVLDMLRPTIKFDFFLHSHFDLIPALLRFLIIETNATWFLDSIFAAAIIWLFTIPSDIWALARDQLDGFYQMAMHSSWTNRSGTYTGIWHMHFWAIMVGISFWWG